MDKIIKEKFYFVRHGKTEWNARQICQGQLDIALSDEGRKEAERLGESITCSFPTICSSPLKRALETAQILQSRLAVPSIIEIDELKERAWGEMEGGSSEAMYLIEEAEEKNQPIPQYRGMETREAFKGRIMKGFNRALSSGPSSLIVSHGRVFLCLCEILEVPLIRQIPNTTLITLEPTKTGWKYL